MTKFLLLFFLSFTLGVPRASAQINSEVDRKAIFETIYNRFLFLFNQSLVAENLHLTGDEQAYADYINRIAMVYTGPVKDQHGKLSVQIPLKFSRDQRQFQLQPGQPPRTAKVGLNWGDQIYVNLKVINDPAIQITPSDVTQILIHEFGHFIPQKNQGTVDSLAAKIKSQLITRQYIVTSTEGLKLSVLKNERFYFGTGHPLLNDPSVDSFINFSSFVILAENKQGIKDISANIIQALETRRRISITPHGQANYNRHYVWKIESVEPISENDSKRTWFKVKATQAEFAAEKTVNVMSEEYQSKNNDQPEKMSSIYDFLIGVNPQTLAVERILNEDRFRTSTIDEKARFEVISDKADAVKLRLTFNESQYSLQPTSKLKAMYSYNNKYFSQNLIKLEKNIYEIEIKKPRGDFLFILESFTIDKSTQVFMTNAIQIKPTLPAASGGTEGRQKGNLKINKIGIEIKDAFYPLKDEMNLPYGKGDLWFSVESSSPIRKIDFYISKTFGILNPEANSNSNDYYENQEKYPFPSERTDHELVTFDTSDFRQVEIRKGVFEISIPYDFSISPLMSPNSTVMNALNENILVAFFNIKELMEKTIKNDIRGLDLAVRNLHYIQVVNDDMEQVVIQKKKPILLRLGGVDFGHPPIPPPPPRRSSCKNIFN